MTGDPQAGREASEPRTLGDLTPTDVLRLLAVSAQSCRALADLAVVDRRLSIATGLATVLFDPELASVSGPGPGAAVGMFLGRCQTRDDDRAWGDAQAKAAGLDGELLRHQAARLVPHALRGSYGAPVAYFNEDRSAYQFRPVAELPYGHTAHLCGYHRSGEIDRRMSALAPKGIRGLLHAQQPADELRAEAVEQLQRAVAAGRLAACDKHTLTLADWQRAISDAEHMLATVHPWTIEAVRAALPIQPTPPDPYATLLRTLFTDPIVWDGKNSRVSSGQHRICGARAAGLDRLLICFSGQ